ncbi:MAG: integrase family protein [Pseudonocardiales bacterium]|nr:integrase family protein [Pseudonocardiales bacterium]
MRWSDVDLARGRLVRRQQVVQVAGAHACSFCGAGHRGLMFGPPKTSSGEARVVDLDGGVVGVLLRQDHARAEWGDAYADHGLVFARPDGNPMSPERVMKRFAQLAAAVNLRHIRLQDLRHGQASLALAAGVSMAVVSKRLGHSTITLASDTYSHLLGWRRA